jgi:hypothetical protein
MPAIAAFATKFAGGGKTRDSVFTSWFDILSPCCCEYQKISMPKQQDLLIFTAHFLILPMILRLAAQKSYFFVTGIMSFNDASILI